MTTMRYRLLGQTGLRVSELFLGAMNFSDQDESGRILDAYAEAGGNVIDTAINYGAGESERIIGELVASRRDRFVVATKYTGSRDTDDPNAYGNHRKNLTHSLETSLRRLRTDYIDLYWVHVWDRHTPIEETMRALDDAVRAGKILYLGISDAPAWVVSRANTLAEWRGWAPFAGLQVPYNLLERDIERELLPMAEAFGMTVASWAPLAHGVLSGKFGARVAPDSLTARDRTVVQALQNAADKLGVTPAQLAIAWTRATSHAIHPIMGVSTVEQLKDNLGATAIEIPAEIYQELASAVEFTAGFPADFIAQCETSPWLTGPNAARLDGRPGQIPWRYNQSNAE